MEFIPDYCYNIVIMDTTNTFKRLLIMELPPGKTAFLWGARKTGKSTYLKTEFPQSTRYDLLRSELVMRYTKAPYQLREEILALPAERLKHPIIIDEIQKVPELLNEIHWLIENSAAAFILCGSSARKLKRNAANLLGGRAWRYHFYPLTFAEINNFDLLRALSHGLIPTHYLEERPQRTLDAYLIDYIQEEIQAEGLVRNLRAFARFLDAVGFSHGELINYTKIAADCGVDAKTIKNYYEILVDTLLGYFVEPYTKVIKRSVLKETPKFYLFDVGVANHLTHQTFTELKGVNAGRAFEHYILMELTAYIGLNNKRMPIRFWRTTSGLEVDFILGQGQIAIEVKISDQVRREDLSGLLAFQEEHQPELALVVSNDPRPRKLKSGIVILPWREFLERLWRGEIV